MTSTNHNVSEPNSIKVKITKFFNNINRLLEIIFEGFLTENVTKTLIISTFVALTSTFAYILTFSDLCDKESQSFAIKLFENKENKDVSYKKYLLERYNECDYKYKTRKSEMFYIQGILSLFITLLFLWLTFYHVNNKKRIKLARTIALLAIIPVITYNYHKMGNEVDDIKKEFDRKIEDIRNSDWEETSINDKLNGKYKKAKK